MTDAKQAARAAVKQMRLIQHTNTDLCLASVVDELAAAIAAMEGK